MEKIHANSTLSEEDKERFIKNNGLMKWNFLKGPFKESRAKLGGVIQEVLFFKEFMIGFFIVLFVEYPLIQLIPSILLVGTTSFLVLKLNPFKSKVLFLTILLNEISYFALLTVYLSYEFLSPNLDIKTRYNIFGYSFISLVLFSMLGNLVLGIAGTFDTLKSLCKKKK